VFPVYSAATKDGGVVLEYGGTDNNVNEFMKLTSGAAVAWTTPTPSGFAPTFAVSDTGTVYYRYRDEVRGGTYIAIIDGGTGNQLISPPPQGGTQTLTSAETNNPPNCASEVGTPISSSSTAQIIGDPILVLGDAYFFTGSGNAQLTYTQCSYSTDMNGNNSNGNYISNAFGIGASASTLDLLKVSPDGSQRLIPITSTSWSGQATYSAGSGIQPVGGSGPVFDFSDIITPDGNGGLLIFWWQSDSTGQTSCNLSRILNDSLQYTVPNPAGGGASGTTPCVYPISAVSTDDSIVYLSMSDGNSYSFDVNQNATLWSKPGEALSATNDDGVFVTTGSYRSVQTTHYNQGGTNDSASFNSLSIPGYVDAGLFLTYNSYGAAQLIPFSDPTFAADPASGWAFGPSGLGGDNSRSKPLGKFTTPEPGPGQCAKAGFDDDSIDPPFAMVPANTSDGSRLIIVHVSNPTLPAKVTVSNGGYINLDKTTLSGTDTTITITGNGMLTDGLTQDAQHPTLKITQGDSEIDLRVDVKSHINQKTIGLFGLYYANVLPAPKVQDLPNFASLLAAELNKDLTAQANVYVGNVPSVQPYSLNYATVNPSFGFHDPAFDNNFDDFKNLAADFSSKVAQKAFIEQDLNGFYVHNFYPPPAGKTGEAGLHDPLYNDIAVMADPLQGSQLSLQNVTTHEFAHILGARDNKDIRYKAKPELMYSRGDGPPDPCHLIRDDWNKMNKPPQPDMYAIAPESGPAGTTVEVAVGNLGSRPAKLFLNNQDITGQIQSWTPGVNGDGDIVTFIVPQGVGSGLVQIISSSGLPSINNRTFTVTGKQ
jgi:hypothetical protein